MSPSLVEGKRRGVDQEHLERYCRPQYLNICDKDQLGFSYNLVGIFGTPDS